MNMEDFINGHPGAEHTLRAQMAEVLGTARAQFFFERMLDYFFNEDDVIFLRKAGAPSSGFLLITGTSRTIPLLSNTRSRVLPGSIKCWATAKTMASTSFSISTRLKGGKTSIGILTTHRASACCGQSPSYQDRYVALWQEFALRYANRAVIAGYDILNEPCSNNEIGDYPWNISSNYRPRWDRMNSLFRRVVSEIRKIDSRHIIFLEGDNYAKQFFGFEKPFDDNLAYSSHNYTVPGFGPGKYPGAYPPGSAAAGGSEVWDPAKQERFFLDADGTRFTQQNDVPLWVGEFGSAYNGPSDENPDRLRALDDQIGIFERNGAHWTTWNYKDVGVMGMLTLDPTSPYMERISDLLRKKKALGTDDWMKWLPPTPVKEATAQLAGQILEVVSDPEIDARLNVRCVSQTLLCFYTGTLMQPLYAGLFKGLSETDLDHILSSFSTKQCVPNQRPGGRTQ